MKKFFYYLVFSFLFIPSVLFSSEIYIRVNQIGFFPEDKKTVIIFSNENLDNYKFYIVNKDKKNVAGPKLLGKNYGTIGSFDYNYKVDFSSFKNTGKFQIKITNNNSEFFSFPFEISDCCYKYQHEMILNFFHQQRCGYNPFLNKYCHNFNKKTSLKDGKVVNGPDKGKKIDVTGGWHDAGDYIKFMITTSNVTYFLLFAYNENPSKFVDNYLANGKPGHNNIPDVLDEAKYGLDWIMKMHPEPDIFYYQVGDERDHTFWSLPYQDKANYDTTPYRPVYYGIGANTAGRAAASFALAYTIWKNKLNDKKYALKCLKHAKSLYKLAKSHKYAIDSKPQDFYNEDSFYDDLELAAIELYKATKIKYYLRDAETFALKAKSGKGWLDWGTMNFIAHYRLYPHASSLSKDYLKQYMDEDLEENYKIYKDNFWGTSVEYVWGSMSVLTGVLIKEILFEKLFNDTKYRDMFYSGRDYLFGKNPWGVCFIVGMGSKYPENVHGQIPAILKTNIYGMPIEGPMKYSEWSDLRINLGGKDKYAKFQSDIVYHDSSNDYATNEMTIFQGALTLCLFSLIDTEKKCENKHPFFRTSNIKFPSPTPTENIKKIKQTILIDDCEDNDSQNKLGGYWYTFDDKEDNGTSVVFPPAGSSFKMSSPGANNSKYCAKMTGKVTTSFQYGYIGMGTGIPLMDLNKFSGIKFWVKGDGKYYNVIIGPDRNKIDTGYNDYKYTFLAPTKWSLIIVPFSNFTQEGGWGKIVSKEEFFKYSKEIVWQTHSQPHESIELAVDDIELYKK